MEKLLSDESFVPFVVSEHVKSVTYSQAPFLTVAHYLWCSRICNQNVHFDSLKKWHRQTFFTIFILKYCVCDCFRPLCTACFNYCFDQSILSVWSLASLYLSADVQTICRPHVSGYCQAFLFSLPKMCFWLFGQYFKTPSRLYLSFISSLYKKICLCSL